MVDKVLKKSAKGKEVAKKSFDPGLRRYMLSIYNYMLLALIVTGLLARIVAYSPTIMNILSSHISSTYPIQLGSIIMFLPLIFGFLIQFRLYTWPLIILHLIFWIYQIVLAVSFSYIFVVYTEQSINQVFFMTAILFAIMSLYGYTTKRDLSNISSFLMMGLLGVIAVSLINIFLHSPALTFIGSIVGVVVFTGLTAYNTQYAKENYEIVKDDEKLKSKFAIASALRLYIDFMYLFNYLLRFIGDRRG